MITMGNNACLTNGELELTQKIQKLFPRGVLTAEQLKWWQGCSAENFTRLLEKFFCNLPVNDFLEITEVIDFSETIDVVSRPNEIFDYQIERWPISSKKDGNSSVEMPTKACVYKQIQDGTFAEILGSFGEDVFWEPDHAILFVKKQKNKIRNKKQWAFFPLKSELGECVVLVSFLSNGITMVESVKNFDSNYRWVAMFNRCFILPQLV